MDGEILPERLFPLMRLFSLFLSFLGLGGTITVTTGTVGNAGNIVADLVNYLSAKLLEVAEFNCVLDQFGDKQPLPSNSSKTIQFVRMEKLAVSSNPSALTEGVAPNATGLVLDDILATVVQYGTLLQISDLAELTAKHNIVERSIYILGLQAAELYDSLKNLVVLKPNYIGEQLAFAS